MLSNIIKYILMAIMFLLAVCLNVHAGDLDDGIEMDDKIEKYDTIEDPGTNIQYIKRSAKASVGSGDNTYTGSGDTTIGGLINQPGAEVGDVTIIFEGEDIIVISE